MDRLIYTAMTGASATMGQEAAVAHNMANATSTGFKTEMHRLRAVPVQNATMPTRAFVADASVADDLSAGPLQHTNRPLDMAIQGKGWLAVQMPDNLREPSHVEMAKTAIKPAYAVKLANAVKARSPLLSAQGYHQILRPLCSRLDIWRTSYHHLLKGQQGIIDMLSSTGLRPFLDPLTLSERDAYLADYKKALRQHYPEMDDGLVLFPFPRLFILAVK